MSASEILIQIILAGLLGITGQLLRIVVGLKKVNEEASKTGVPAKDILVVSKMVISILIGFATGVLAWLAVANVSQTFVFTKDVIMGIIAAGYSGTDFIEGIISKYLPQSGTTPTPTPASGSGTEDSYVSNKPIIKPQTDTPPSQGQMNP